MRPIACTVADMVARHRSSCNMLCCVMAGSTVGGGQAKIKYVRGGLLTKNQQAPIESMAGKEVALTNSPWHKPPAPPCTSRSPDGVDPPPPVDSRHKGTQVSKLGHKIGPGGANYITAFRRRGGVDKSVQPHHRKRGSPHGRS